MFKIHIKEDTIPDRIRYSTPTGTSGTSLSLWFLSDMRDRRDREWEWSQEYAEYLESISVTHVNTS